MKKLFLSLTILLMTVFTASALDFVYRELSGEVIFIGLISDGPGDVYNPVFMGRVVDPPTPDGIQLLSPLGADRVLGYAKIHDSGTIRNATQNEIDTFLSAAIVDKNLMQTTSAKNYFQNNPQIRKILISLMGILIELEINQNRERWRVFDEQIALADSLADLKARMAALATTHPMPDRTLSQLKAQMITRLENSQND